MRTSVLLAWLSVSLLALVAAFLGGTPRVLVDIPSLVLVGLGGLALSVVIAPLQAHIRALRLALSHGPIGAADADAALAVLRGHAVALLMVGVLGDSIGMAQVFMRLGDPAAVGLDLAVSARTVLYALVWCAVVVWPLHTAIQARRQAPSVPEDAARVPSAVGGASLGLALLGYGLAKGGVVLGVCGALGWLTA